MANKLFDFKTIKYISDETGINYDELVLVNNAGNSHKFIQLIIDRVN